MTPPILLVAGHLKKSVCQLPRTRAPAAEVIDVDAEKKAVPAIFACSYVQLAHGRRVRIAGRDDQSRRWFPGVGRFSEGMGV